MYLVLSILDWLKTNEYLAVWLEGIALVAIFLWDRFDASQQHEQTLAQMETMQNQARATETAANAANKSAETLVNSERAWVLVDIGRLPPFTPDPNQLQVLWIFPTIKNYGKTVARIKRVAGVIKLIPEGEKLPVVPEYPIGQGFDLRVDTVLPPEVPVRPRLAVTGNEFIRVQNGELQLIVHGLVEYFDGVSENPRCSAYCFGYQIQSGFSPSETGFYSYLTAPPAYTECT